MSGLAWSARLVVLLPAVAALVGVLLPRRARAAQAAVAVTGTAGALVAAAVELARSADSAAASAALLPPVPTGAGTLHLTVVGDRYGAVIALMVTTVALCVQVYSIGYQVGDQRYRAFAANVSLFTAAMLLVVHAQDLVLLLIGWEVMGLCSYLLVGHESEREAARVAAVKAFLVTRFGDAFFLIGIVVLWVATGTTNLGEPLPPGQGWTDATLTASTLLIVIGVIGKSAQLPLNTWLPDAMEGPTPVSALIHAATMVAAGGVVLARLLPMLLGAPAAAATLAVVTAVTMLASALVACVQTDLKRVLAWSTISQIAYVLAALAVATPETGTGPSTVQLLSHAGFKALLFLTAGAMAHQVHSTAMGDLAGAGRRSPLLAVLFTLGLASLAGLPPLSGFWSKEAVLSAAEAGAHGAPGWTGWLVLVSGLLTALVTAGYCARTWWLVVRETPRTAHEELAEVDDVTAGEAVAAAEGGVPVTPVPAVMSWPLLVLAVPTVAGGLLLAAPGLVGEVHLEVGTTVLGGLVSVAGVLAVLALAGRAGDPAALLPGRVQRVLSAGFGLDAAQDRLVVRPARALGRLVTAGDRDVVDAYVRGAGGAARWAGIGLRRLQTGVTTGYLTWLVAGGVVAVVLGVGLR